MSTRKLGAWWVAGLAAALWADAVLANDPVVGNTAIQPIAADGGELRLSVGSDVTSLSGEDLRAATKNLVAPLLAAGIRAQTVILVDANSGADLQSFSIAEVQ